MLTADYGAVLASAPLESDRVDRRPPVELGDRELLDKLGDTFTARVSARFTIISDVDATLVKQLAESAEATFARITAAARRLELDTNPSPSRSTVVFFDSWADYESFARERDFAVDERVPGFFDERSRRCYVFNFANSKAIRQRRQEILVARAEMIASGTRPESHDEPAQQARNAKLQRIREIEAALDQQMELINATVIRHEIAHQVLLALDIQSASDRTPRWLSEGLAMQFETLDQPNPFRLADFLALDSRKTPLGLNELIHDPKVIGPGATDPQRTYAAAWALVYYLIDAHPRAFATYLQDVGKVASDERLFECAFAKPDAAFERKWRGYFQRFR